MSHIKKKNKDIPVIIISGHANIEMAIKSLKSGAFEFIQKPFDQERLINFVNRAVENYKLIKENGYFFAEDLISVKKLSTKNLSELSIDLYANYLPSYEKYLNDLEKKGFEIIYHNNMSKKWAKFVKKRKLSHEYNKKRNIRVHGEKTHGNINYFYNIVDKYFSSQKLGGIKVIAKKI